MKAERRTESHKNHRRCAEHADPSCILETLLFTLTTTLTILPLDFFLRVVIRGLVVLGKAFGHLGV